VGWRRLSRRRPGNGVSAYRALAASLDPDTSGLKEPCHDCYTTVTLGISPNGTPGSRPARPGPAPPAAPGLGPARLRPRPGPAPPARAASARPGSRPDLDLTRHRRLAPGLGPARHPGSRPASA